MGKTTRFKKVLWTLFALVLCVAGLASSPAYAKKGRHHVHPHHHGWASRHHGHGFRVVIIGKGHRHSRHCGHYRYKGAWFYRSGHVHGAFCGHQYFGGLWVIR